MKIKHILGAAALGLFAAANALALTVKPYTAAEFSAAQAKGAPVALHFHADWCPTCKAQAVSLDKLKAKTDLNLTVLVANYDDEKALKKQYGVRSQSTLVVFKGNTEVARIAGETAPEPIETALRKAL